jgi:glutamyl-tRNA synthetase
MKNSITLSQDEVERRLASGAPYVIRLKVPRHETVRFQDAVRGWVSFETGSIDDQVLIKSDGLPTYHLANVVDDHLMQISHVIRGDEWLPSTPKHILLYQFLGWPPPAMAHLPLILSPTGGKLSKRNADNTQGPGVMNIPVSVHQYREAGYEPAALLNFLAFLGWNPGTEQEVFDLDELVEAFSIDRVGSSGVQFNLEKLRWYNEQFIRRMDVETLAEEARPYFVKYGQEVDLSLVREITALMQERITFVEELVTTTAYFFEDPSDYDPAGLKRWKAESPDLIRIYAELLEFQGSNAFTAETAKTLLNKMVETHGIKFGQIMAPLRLALTGQMSGPGLFELMEVIGADACIRRMRRAADVLSIEEPASRP